MTSHAPTGFIAFESPAVCPNEFRMRIATMALRNTITFRIIGSSSNNSLGSVTCATSKEFPLKGGEPNAL